MFMGITNRGVKPRTGITGGHPEEVGARAVHVQLLQAAVGAGGSFLLLQCFQPKLRKIVLEG